MIKEISGLIKLVNKLGVAATTQEGDDTAQEELRQVQKDLWDRRQWVTVTLSEQLRRHSLWN